MALSRSLIAFALWLILAPSALAEDVRTTTDYPAHTYSIDRLPAAAAPTARKGKLRINITVQVSPNLPNGSTITFFPTASVIDATYSNTASQAGKATVAGGKASKTFDIPYSWVVASAGNKVTVNISIFGSAIKNAVRYSNNTFLTRTIPLPANGATTVLTFSDAI